MIMPKPKVILITGATGYVGGRLLKALEGENYILRCLVRDPQRIQGRFTPQIQVFKGDVSKPDSLMEAMKEVDVAYYLVHSMGSDASYAKEDRLGAQNFANAASQAGIKRIIYLGGLGSNAGPLSTHLRSRHEVGEILKSAKNVQVIEFRASIIIGSGSLSFEMIRALCERLPVMITPKWVWTMAQPIAIRDVLSYLKKAAENEITGNRIFEIGGRDRISYGGIMLEYIKQRNLKRWILPVPVLTPWLSSLWLGLVTPLYSRVGRKIIDSASVTTIANDAEARRQFKIQPIGVSEAISLAINKEIIDTHWSDALSTFSSDTLNLSEKSFGNRLMDKKVIEVPVSPEEAFKPIRRIGGRTGWYSGNILWGIRGFIDRLVGGVGLRRGRRMYDDLRVGDSLDFWRVEAFEPNRRLLLHAEMKVPGRAWLEFKVEPTLTGSAIHQTAIFDPLGLSGLLYWYILYPIHHFVFQGMINGIANEALKAVKKDKS